MGEAALHVTQPTLSAQVRELEATRGIRLFERAGRRIEITEIGRRADRTANLA